MFGMPMRQVLFYLPLKSLAENLPEIPLYVPAALLVVAVAVLRWRKLSKGYYTAAFIGVGVVLGLSLLKGMAGQVEDVPIYGYGTMLFVAFVFCTWLASRLAVREGIEPRHVQDVAIWIFFGGIIGARLTYMIQYRHEIEFSLLEFFRIWDGGLVFYGSAIGGAVGYFLAYFLTLRKYNISSWKMADAIAPCAALGLCLGRIGCLLNGCCYGNVACAGCPPLRFYLCSPPRAEMVARGYQTAAGFTMARPEGFNPEALRTVGKVEADSPAAAAGLRSGDVIVEINGKTVESSSDINKYLGQEWERGQTDLELGVRREGKLLDPPLPPFTPRTLGLHPTQVYESVSMGLLFFLLLCYYPFKKHDGSVMVLFMLAYAVHRFLNEMLRTDTKPVDFPFHLTLSQNLSILVVVAGLALGVWVRLRPAAASNQLTISN
jgi:phosphatidylglycerol:prolipoprotein diacylglycerol transferase